MASIFSYEMGFSGVGWHLRALNQISKFKYKFEIPNRNSYI